MKRVIFVLIAICFIVVMALPAKAQSGACPPGSVSVGSISGTVPNNTDICVTSLNRAWVETDSNYPCSQQVVVDWQAWLTPAFNEPIFIVPDPSNYYGYDLRVRFLVSGQDPSLFGPPLEDFNYIYINISYYDENNVLQDFVKYPIDNYDVVYTYYSNTFNYYYPVYVIDQVLNTTEPYGGYVSVRLWFDTDNASYPSLEPPDVKYSSIQIGAHNDYFPAHCPLPNGDLPSTPQPGPTPTGTLPPTWTPNPTGTATPTPITTPAATATGAALQSTWTPTPITFATIAAENTPTPWPPYVIPTVNWPTPYPTVYAMTGNYQSTVEAINPTREAVTDGLLSAAANINETWGTPRAQARSFTDPNNTGYITTTTNTGTAITEYITYPVGYIRGISGLMPNAWTFILWLFALVGLVIFSVTSKFWLAVFKTIMYLVQLVIDFLYKIWTAIWELIPL